MRGKPSKGEENEKRREELEGNGETAYTRD
jgi:hypothetical protein